MQRTKKTAERECSPHDTQKSKQPKREQLQPANALAQGLEVLRLLVDADGPLTATEIARRIGMHQSSASRILKTLNLGGYVRKPDFRSFTVDYGVLGLIRNAARHFPELDRALPALHELAAKKEGMAAGLAGFWKDQLIYFQRVQLHQEPLGFWFSNYPLHLSSPALRLMLEWPASDALRLLQDSRQRMGWERPLDRVPKTPQVCLETARRLLVHDCLVLDGWQGPGRVTASIIMQGPQQSRLALTFSGHELGLSQEQLCLLLLEGRHTIEQVFLATEERKPMQFQDSESRHKSKRNLRKSE